MTDTQNVRTPATHPLRTVAVVSSHPHEHVLETVTGAVDHDVVFVESSAHAYSTIKRVTPDLVIVCLSDDDMEGCQLLSLLMLDSDTARIPVATYLTAPADELPDDAPGAGEDVGSQCVPVSLN